MSALLVGYARVSAQDQDLTAQRDALAALGVPVARTYVDHGLAGSKSRSSGAPRGAGRVSQRRHTGVTKLDRLARSLPDARDILEDLTTCEVKLSIGCSVHEPTDPVRRLLFNVLAMVAEFEFDLIRLRTKEGMRVAKAKGHLRGRPPKLNPRQAVRRGVDAVGVEAAGGLEVACEGHFLDVGLAGERAVAPSGMRYRIARRESVSHAVSLVSATSLTIVAPGVPSWESVSVLPVRAA